MTIAVRSVACAVAAFLAASVLAASLAVAAGKPVAPPDGEPRTALVIGNSAYKTSPLRNPVNDAKAIAEALEAVGFDVILKLDASRRELRRSMIDFGRKLGDGGVGLFYYAGHGIAVSGENYLIPVDAEIEVEDHVSVEAVSLNQVLARMGGARNRLNIVVLDACRNNPFARTFRSATRGLAQTLAPAGTYIAYATAPGDVAEDGDGANSVYTASLAKAVRDAGVKIEDVFKNVRRSVQDTTAGRQVPWTSSSITGDFYFTPVARPAAAPTPAPLPAARSLELAFWNSIQDSRNASDFEEYLKQFPDGTFSGLARNRIDALQASPAESRHAALTTPEAAPSRAPVAGDLAAALTGRRIAFRRSRDGREMEMQIQAGDQIGLYTELAPGAGMIEVDTGRWWLIHGNVFCFKFWNGFKGRQICSKMERQGDSFVARHPKNRKKRDWRFQ